MSVELSPETRVYIKVNRLKQLKSPKLCLSVDSSDETNEDKSNGFKDTLINKMGINCNSCQVLKRLVCIKDIAINRLTEDREELKLKLTQIHNKNIELTQRIKRFESPVIEKQESSDCIEYNEKYIELKANNEELEAINRHLRQHLNTLRQVFNELHNSSESTGNETTVNTTSNTTTQSVVKSTSNETKTKSTSTDLNENYDKTNEKVVYNSDNNNLTIDKSLEQNSKSSFDKWYNI